ncbi:Fasciclin-like arabinogalactan protein 10 [Camellia lanceoleosa]|uniref:Fasciclin-like arabinogalactan protein 10 n=1 Tax=Camellia lanceoleosa TaxID=1840588 RepID=A0ACC0IQ95_9ERIC|nr:Fasciclin-like arabinogalactan protein 10 [Camellia lanceoleosa]
MALAYTMGARHFIFLILTLSLIITIPTMKAHNITEILSSFPDYTLFNSYLTQTRLCDEINSRETITVLVLNETSMSILASKHPLSIVKAELSIHILLDYFDAAKLHDLATATTTVTTLYQTTGEAENGVGFVNITDLQGGKVGFRSAAPGSALDSTYTKEVKKVPYSIAVLEISEPIIAPGILNSPAGSASDVNITDVIVKAGCRTFASLIVETGVLNVYRKVVNTGLTIFAPSDEAFKASNLPDLSKLTNAEVIALLRYHALASYDPIGTLKTIKNPMATLATNSAGKFDLTVNLAGDEVTLKAGRDSSRISSTLIDSTPLCIFTVDHVLIPIELFGNASSPAPAPKPVTSPSPSTAPAPSPVVPAPKSAEAPPPVYSPPAPPTETPAGSPAEGPNQAQNSTSGNVAGVKAPALFNALSVLASVIVSLLS